MHFSQNVLCAFAIFAVVLFGQADANKGQIVGTVFDANQAAIPNASVKITNTANGLVRELKQAGPGSTGRSNSIPANIILRR